MAEQRNAPTGLVGAYACYSHAWSPHFQGKLIRGSLGIEATAGDGPTLRATYSETISLGQIQLSGPVAIINGSIHLDLIDAGDRFRWSMHLFVPGILASVLAGIVTGTTVVDAHPVPAATRIVMIRIPGAAAGALELTNRYLDPAEEPLSSDLSALGVPVGSPAELDALLEGFLRGDDARGYIKLAAAAYSELTLAFDRLFIGHDLIAGVRPRPAPARPSPSDWVRLVQS